MLRSRRGIGVLTLMLVIGLGSCSDVPWPSSPDSEDSESAMVQGRPISSPAQPFANQLARGVALAMRNPQVRIVIRDAMRDSRFHEHKVHLRSLLKDQRANRSLMGLSKN